MGSFGNGFFLSHASQSYSWGREGGDSTSEKHRQTCLLNHTHKEILQGQTVVDTEEARLAVLLIRRTDTR